MAKGYFAISRQAFLPLACSAVTLLASSAVWAHDDLEFQKQPFQELSPQASFPQHTSLPTQIESKEAVSNRMDSDPVDHAERSADHSEFSEGAEQGIRLWGHAQATMLMGAQSDPVRWPLAGIGTLKQPDVLWGGTELGIAAHTRMAERPVQLSLGTAYDDSLRQFILHDLRLQFPLSTDWQIAAGRLNPLLVDTVHPARLAPVVFEAMLGDSHWHADGVQLVHHTPQWQWVAAGYGLGKVGHSHYPGAKGPVALWSLAARWKSAGFPQWENTLQVGYVPELERVTTPATVSAGGHTHGNATACTAQQTCLGANAQMVMVSSRWHPLSHQPGAVLSLFGLWREETGTLAGPNGQSDYRGELTSWALEARYPLSPQWTLGATQEWLGIQHRLKGINAQVLAHDAGLDVPNTHTPQRTTVMLDYASRQGWGVQLGAVSDHRRTEADTLLTLSLRYEWGWSGNSISDKNSLGQSKLH